MPGNAYFEALPHVPSSPISTRATVTGGRASVIHSYAEHGSKKMERTETSEKTSTKIEN
jgi:hypothetical protein